MAEADEEDLAFVLGKELRRQSEQKAASEQQNDRQPPQQSPGGPDRT
jgi:hypothetical protein